MLFIILHKTLKIRQTEDFIHSNMEFDQQNFSLKKKINC